MAELVDELKELQKDLKEQIELIQNQIEDSPEGRIEIQKRQEKNRMYLISPDKNGKQTRLYKTKRYLKESELALAEKLMAKNYYQSLLPILQEELKRTEAFLEYYRKNLKRKEKMFDALAPERKKVIDNVFASGDYLSKIWLNQPYQTKGIAEGERSFESENGDKVRSKSELIISNALSHNHIPFKYEYPLLIKEKGIVLYPDFTLLNVRKRKIYYWEHLGMLDDPEYLNAAIKRLHLLEESGLMIGKKLLVTYEDSKHPLDISLVNKYIKEYLQ